MLATVRNVTTAMNDTEMCLGAITRGPDRGVYVECVP